MEKLLAKHIELVEAANNSRTDDEHNIALAKLAGFRDAMDCMSPRPLHLIECDQHYLMQGIDRPMCCGVWLDWMPNAEITAVLGAVPPRLTFERISMKLQELKALAEAVKGWGNCTDAWLDHSEDEPAAVVGHIDDDGNTYPVTTVDCDQYYAAADSLKLAKFYAAANPEMVLRIIAMIEAPNVEVSGGGAFPPSA